MLTINLPDMQQHFGGLIPGGVDDLLWWAQAGANSWVLDHLVGVLHELLGMCEQQEQLEGSAAAGVVIEIVRQVRCGRHEQLPACA